MVITPSPITTSGQEKTYSNGERYVLRTPENTEKYAQKVKDIGKLKAWVVCDIWKEMTQESRNIKGGLSHFLTDGEYRISHR
jgi:hypothetical protein